MLPLMMMLSNSTSLSDELSSSSVLTRVQDFGGFNPKAHSASSAQQQAPPPPPPPPPLKIKKKRNLPGNPDPDAEVIALSPCTLMATNRFVCEVCNKGFQRDQNLQLHRRGHNLPWKLKQKSSKENRKKAYVCPEKSCVHHHPSRALGDLTGIKKHYCRKHGEKKFKCDKCSKIYAVRSDWKAHSKICGTKEYKCDCGTIFSRKDSFITHRAFCDALSEESARMSANPLFAPPLMPPPAAANNSQFLLHPNLQNPPPNSPFQFQQQQQQHHHLFDSLSRFSNNQHAWDLTQNLNPNQFQVKPDISHIPHSTPAFFQDILPPPQPHKRFHPLPDLVNHFSATALLQKAEVLGPHSVGQMQSTMIHLDMANIAGNMPAPEYPGAFGSGDFSAWQKNDRLTQTRDFLGLTGDQLEGGGSGGGESTDLNGRTDLNMRGLMSFAESLDFSASTNWRNC